MLREIRTVACAISGGVDSAVSAYLLKRNGLQVDAIATGHYCRNSLGNFLQQKTNQEATLMRSIDPVKDQTFWLSTISHKDLQRCMFPVGGLLKPSVKQIAVDIGLKSIAARRESMGMCFIGKRSFGQFIDSYIEPRHGVFKELETGLTLDEHTGVHHYTLGQRAPIKRYNGPFYISRMDARSQTIYVVRDPSHPSLFFRKCWTGPAIWINSVGPQLPSLMIRFQWQNKWRSIACRMIPHPTLRDASHDACQSTSCAVDDGTCEDLLHSIPREVDAQTGDQRPSGPCLVIELAEPMRCIAAGQWSAFYDGERCLGGAMVCGAVSLWDEGWQDSYTGWKQNDFEITYGNLLEKGFRPRR